MADLLMWLDTEATGLNGPGDPTPSPLEVAWQFTNPRLFPVDKVRSLFCWDGWFTASQLWDEFCHPVAFDMHKRSGLFVDWHRWAVTDPIGRGNLERVDAAMLVSLRETKEMLGADRVVVAGSGVGPYDVPLLRYFFPNTAAAVHYRPVDISSVRAFAHAFGVEAPFDEKDRPHRAAGDVERSIVEARWWASRLFGETAEVPGEAA